MCRPLLAPSCKNNKRGCVFACVRACPAGAGLQQGEARAALVRRQFSCLAGSTRVGAAAFASELFEYLNQRTFCFLNSLLSLFLLPEVIDGFTCIWRQEPTVVRRGGPSDAASFRPLGFGPRQLSEQIPQRTPQHAAGGR